MRLLICALLALLLTGCELVMTDPTRTPTPDMPPLDASPTIDPLPPTPDPLGQSGGLGFNNPTAAAQPALSELNPEAAPAPDDPLRPVLLTVTLPDGTLLNGELYTDPSLRPLPAVLLLATRLDAWGGFPALLREAGFSVLLLETRAPALDGDFRAMLDALSRQPGVDPGAIAVIGAELTADVALVGCAADARCVTTVLLSPQQEAPLVSALRGGYNPRPLLISASLTDQPSLRTAEALRQTATGESLLQPFDGEWRGAQILTLRPDMNTLIIQWLRRHLVELRGG